jgi:hypothetical protein
MLISDINNMVDDIEIRYIEYKKFQELKQELKKYYYEVDFDEFKFKLNRNNEEIKLVYTIKENSNLLYNLKYYYFYKRLYKIRDKLNKKIYITNKTKIDCLINELKKLQNKYQFKESYLELQDFNSNIILMRYLCFSFIYKKKGLNM